MTKAGCTDAKTIQYTSPWKDAISAIRMVEEKFLSDKETELQRLESENYLLHKAREISGR